MNENYAGWSLFPTIKIYARRYQKWRHPERTELGYKQGYIADPTNKKQCKTAKDWATTIEYGEYDTETRSYPNMKTIHAEEYEFENKGFTLELLDAAEGSTQGGKLSFWNCLIKKDGHEFVVGIAANLLLDVLKSTTIINGVVQEPLMFARCNGGVGMLCESMDAYKQAQSDMQRKKDMSRGKTSKVVIGNVYHTVTQSNVYFGRLYRWYEPIYEYDSGIWSRREKLVGFKRLDKPVEYWWFPSYESDKTKMSEYIHKGWLSLIEKKPPARVEGDEKVIIDATLQDLVDYRIEKDLVEPIKEKLDAKTRGYTVSSWFNTDVVGLSPNGDSYELPQKVVDILTAYELKIVG